jgi:hypothetical protein
MFQASLSLFLCFWYISSLSIELLLLGFGSLEQILVAQGMGHTMEDRFMMVMDMLCHRLMIQACMLQQLRHMGLTLYMAATSSK